MPGNSFGHLFTVTTWGESHGPAAGVVIDGCPAGLKLSEKDIQKDLDRRRVGQSKVASPRDEPDQVKILSGIFNSKTTGTPMLLIIYNKDIDSSKYEKIKDIFRPGHADYTYFAKYGIRDYKGGGRASARETAARVAAGAVAKKILSLENIEISGYTKRIGDIEAKSFDLHEIENNIVRCPDRLASQKMIDRIMKVKEAGDSIGGIIEIRAIGVPAGLGEPVFDKLDADIAKAMMGIPSVKGVEIGAGFACVSMSGSQNNDEYTIKNGNISTKTNNSGGILGGISNGNDIIVRIAVKPTSSISKPQCTVNKDGEKVTLQVEGRHDPCICPRAIPVAESMLALVLADHLLRNRTAQVKNC